VKLQVGFNRRFDANFERVRACHRERRDRHAPPDAHHQPRPRSAARSYIKVSGGMFLDMTIHDFDMARFLIGDEVETEVYTAAGVRVDPAIGEAGDVDTALIVLRFPQRRPSGPSTIAARRCTATISASKCLGSAGRSRRRTVSESRGSQHGRIGPPRPAAELLHGPLHSRASQRVAGVRRCRVAGRADAGHRHDGRIPVVMALAARKSYERRAAGEAFRDRSARRLGDQQP
jgi:myo-inositol 2-dehydrogenase / D-chiro-inositol 1-dehydrogenase